MISDAQLTELKRQTRERAELLKAISKGETLSAAQELKLEEITERGKDPVFLSRRECSRQTGIPESVMAEAKKGGCKDIDSHGRVNLYGLLRWLYANTYARDEDWAERKKRAEALREEIRLAKDNDLVADKEETLQSIAENLAVLWEQLDRALLSELPAVTAGLDEMGVKRQNQIAIERIKSHIKSLFEKPVAVGIRTQRR